MNKQNRSAPRRPGKGLGSAYFTSKSGKRFYAKDYGYKCWPFYPARNRRAPVVK